MLENPNQLAITVSNLHVSQISAVSCNEKSNNLKSPGTVREILTMEPVSNVNNNNNNNRTERSLKPVSAFCETWGKANHPIKMCYFCSKFRNSDEETRNQMRTVPRKILTLDWVPLSIDFLNFWLWTQMRYLTALD